MKRGLGGARPAMGDHRALPTRFGGFGANQSTSTLSYLAEPPSLTAVSDPHVVVLIKNILKKDSTTKARALEELLNHVQGAAQDIDDALLEIWVEIYPRVSIDNARRVRELSHTLQYELLKAGRKRMERRLSGIVATWIAGSFDRDRGVSRAAETGLKSFLNTPEKMNAFWLKCQSQILDFAVDSIRETPDTLSDERSTTKEDAEGKHYRVVYASLCLINGLLQRASAEDLSTFESKYEDYFEGDAVWKNIQCPDSSIRRAVCHLMFACLDRGLPYADSKSAKQVFLVGGLQTSHSGTALEYVRALSKLTEAHPQMWTSVEGKKSPMTRLLAFIAKGSQGSPPLFWDKLDQLLQALLLNDASLEFASDLSNAIQKGITHRAEPKTNTSSAWKCYIDITKRLLHALSPEDQLSFASAQFFPLFERFLFSSPGSTDQIPLGPNSMGILVEAQAALMQGSSELHSALEREWDRLSVLLCENISGVLPEVSKDFKISQERLGEEGRRWFGLVGEMRRATDGDTDLTAVVNGPSTSVINRCLEVLRKRNMKPFGAARILEFALSNSGYLFEGRLGQQLIDFLSTIETVGMQMFVDSPSMPSVVSSLRLLRGISSCHASALKIWKSWAASIIDTPQSNTRDAALVSLISSDDISKTVQETGGIQDFILKHVREGTHSEDFLATVMTHDALSPHSSHKLVRELVQGLDVVSEEQLFKLRSLETLIKAKPTLFQDEDIHTRLVRQLLSLEEMQNPQVSAKATGVRSLLSGDLGGAHLPVVSIIQQNLESAGPQCLGIETLIQQAQDALKGGASLEEIFPSTNAFMQSLLPFLGQPVDPSLAIMNVTGGAVLLVNPQDMSSRPPPRDSQGRSIPVRVALYVCHLLASNPDISTLPVKFQVELLYLQGLIVQMVSDQISLHSNDGLWKSLETTDMMEQAMWLVSTGQSQLLDNIRSCNDWSESADGESQPMPQLVELLTRESRALTPTALYSSRILSEIIQSVAERQGIPPAWESSFLSPEALKIGTDTVLVTAAVLTGFGDALRPLKSINTLCNRLVSDIAAAKLSSEKTAILLTLLTLCGSVYDSGTLPIPSNRVVFAVKQVADWFDGNNELSPEFASECLRCLAQLLPCIKDVYGSFWEKTLQFCMVSCENASKYPLNRVLPLLQAALKLVKDLSEMEEVNDDLEESLSDISKQKGAVMIELLRLDRDVATQPLEIVDRLLCREVEKLAISQLPEPEELYGLVASESATLQTTAFVLLHRIVPEQQQKKSVNIMLDNLNARLPDELLSLLLDAPTLEQFTDEMLATFPVSVRGYLLSWKLIFDAYAASPFKIRADFTEGLKAENPLGPLLDFMFDVLGHSAGYPLKLEKEGILQDQIRDFDIKLADAEVEEKSMHWLMAHLFYLILKYVPGLFRTWYQDCRSKQTKMAVESWTESFFSTLVIEDALDDVQTWLDSEDFNSSNEADIGVKVSKSGKEVTITYEIDESEGAMAIKLPNNFPIEGVTARGIRRVAVNEKKWQSWIMTTQGVITFANGNIIDGVQAFRRNLTGAIRGHSECAICYSVISADQRVPEKSCTTCKNLFHRLCLYKWFQTSNNNTCPLCRTPIDFAGASNLKRRI